MTVSLLLQEDNPQHPALGLNFHRVSQAEQGEGGNLHALAEFAPSMVRLEVGWAEKEIGDGYAFAHIADIQPFIVIAVCVIFTLIESVLDDVPDRFPLT